MADYNLFLRHLGCEDDLVTEEYKVIQALKQEKARVAQNHAAAQKKAASEFHKKMDDLVAERNNLENDSEVVEARTSYEHALDLYEMHWQDRGKKLAQRKAADEKDMRIIKKINKYILIASVIIALVSAIVGIIKEL